MMNKITSIVLLTFIASYTISGQSFKTENIIIDKTTKLPLENVCIYNEKDNSTSNAEGKFVFVSSKNEIHFALLSYNPITTTFETVAKQDTVFMEFKATELREVVITNLEPFMKKVYDKMNENMISNHTTNFFLRNILKKDDSIVKLQDIYGKKIKVGNKKDNTEIEILNMRKTGILERKTIDLKFPDFNEFFSPPFPFLEKNTFTEEDYKDTDYRKIDFVAKEKNDWGQTLKGYFIVNSKDYAIVEYFISLYDDPKVVPYRKIPFFGTQFRTIKYDRLLKFLKDAISGKYYLNQSKQNAMLEVLADKRNKETFYYNLAMDYFATGSPTSEVVNSNFSVDKDIFKAKFPYSATFWESQNQLPLTQELKNFLKRVEENKDKKKEFEIIGNF